MLDRAREWWERLGRTNQVTLALTTAGVLIALIGFVVWAGTPEYALLFSNLSAQDANAITEKLREANVPFRLSSGGTSIEIPAQHVDEQHMKLVSQGFPQQSPGATTASVDDILNGQHIGDTSGVEQLRMRRSLEERVGKSIMMMDPIANVVVHYAASDNDPLLLSNHESSASVIVTAKPGRSLTDENVYAIVRLTQMAYTGLEEKNISVVDSKAGMLWNGTHTGGAGGSDINKERIKYETDKRSELQNALNIVCGPRSSIVTVSAEFNTDTKNEHKIEVLPGAVIHKASNDEKMEGPGSIAGRPAPGANANVGGLPTGAAGGPGVPGYQQQASTSDPSSRYTNATQQADYEPGKTETTTQSGPGKLEKVSVSVLVDSNKYKDPAALADIKAKIKETVATSIGLATGVGLAANGAPGEATTGRLVSVVDMPFDHSQELQDQQIGEQQRRADMVKQLASLLVPFLIMAIALYLLARAFRKANPNALSSMPALAGAGAGMGALPPGSSLLLDEDGVPLPGQMVGGAGEIDGEGGPIALSAGMNAPRSFEVIEEAFDANLESILHLTRSKPEMVAMLVKSWISEEQ